MQAKSDYEPTFDPDALHYYCVKKFDSLNPVDQDSVLSTIVPMERIGVNEAGKRFITRLNHAEKLELLLMLGTWVNHTESLIKQRENVNY